MKSIGILLLAAVFSFSSCVRYQYLAMNSDDTEKQNQYWVFEDEKVKLEYYFSGQHLPVNLRITNKTSQELFIDWRKSFVVLDPKVTPTSSHDSGYRYSETNTSEEKRIPMTKFMTRYLVEKLEPFQARQFSQMYLLAGNPLILKDYPTKRHTTSSTKHGHEAKRTRVYAADNTPLRFAQELTFHFGEVDKNTFEYRHLFYVQKAMNAGRNIQWPVGESVTLTKDTTVTGLHTILLGVLVGTISIILTGDYSGDYSWDDDSWDDGW